MNCFGHYPFQLFCENKSGDFEMGSLALGGDVASCYRVFGKHIKGDAKRVYLSLDFPKGGDIENDYIAIFTFENGVINVFAIPYDTEDGKTFDIVKNGSQIDLMKKQMNFYL
jgi:hypothetical protein